MQFRRQQKAGTHERRVQQVYGLPSGAYQRMYLFQGGLCAICRRASGKTRRLSVDHDHKTGLVRMLLCRPCNDMLGHARDDPEFFLRAARMLTNPPARHLGIVAYHKDNRKEVGGGDLA